MKLFSNFYLCYFAREMMIKKKKSEWRKKVKCCNCRSGTNKLKKLVDITLLNMLIMSDLRQFSFENEFIFTKKRLFFFPFIYSLSRFFFLAFLQNSRKGHIGLENWKSSKQIFNFHKIYMQYESYVFLVNRKSKQKRMLLYFTSRYCIIYIHV